MISVLIKKNPYIYVHVNVISLIFQSKGQTIWAHEHQILTMIIHKTKSVQSKRQVL